MRHYPTTRRRAHAWCASMKSEDIERLQALLDAEVADPEHLTEFGGALVEALPELLAAARERDDLRKQLACEVAVNADYPDVVAERDELKKRVAELEGEIGKARCMVGGAGNDTPLSALVSARIAELKTELATLRFRFDEYALGYVNRTQQARIAQLAEALRQIAGHGGSQEQMCDYHCTVEMAETARAALETK